MHQHPALERTSATCLCSFVLPLGGTALIYCSVVCAGEVVFYKRPWRVPSYHRILVKHGLIEKTLPIPDAYKVFLQVGADPEVQKLRRK
jgi:hypothetical protein